MRLGYRGFLLLLVAGLLFWSGNRIVAEMTKPPLFTFKKNYKFSADYFSWNAKKWPDLLKDLKGKPGLKYLEIGVLEGRSLFWVMENILTHESSRATAVDIFVAPYEAAFLANLELSGQKKRIELVKGRSEEALRKLTMNSYDLIYIDGSHQGKDVFLDSALSWGLLKEGGVMIFDDYALDVTHPPEAGPNYPINAFLATFRGNYELLDRDYQVVLKKHASPCETSQGCAALGPYAYEFETKTLKNDKFSARLDGEQAAYVEGLFKNRLESDLGPRMFEKFRKSEACKTIFATAPAEEKRCY